MLILEFGSTQSTTVGNSDRNDAGSPVVASERNALDATTAQVAAARARLDDAGTVRANKVADHRGRIV